MKVEWAEITQWSKFWMSSDSGIPGSICPLIGGPANHSILPLDRQKITVKRGGCSYHLQEVDIDGEKFTAYRCHGLFDTDFYKMLKLWLPGYYEEKINELISDKIEIA